MQNYTITISDADSKEESLKHFSQTEIDSLLDYAAPYNEQTLIAEYENDINRIAFYIEVATDGDFYRWRGACYNEKLFSLMVTTAIKKSLLETLKQISE